MRSIITYSSTNDPEYDSSYSMFGAEIEKLGGELYLCRPPNAYLGGTTFDGGCRVNADGLRPVATPVTGTLIFNKSISFRPEAGAWTVNHPAFSAMCEKDGLLKHFARYSPMAILVQSETELTEALDRLPGDMVVTKPPRNYGGHGVRIGPKRDVRPAELQYPLVAQEFVDSSGGIPGIAPSHHDLRLVYIGGVLVDCYVRQPTRGKLLSNVSQGGSIRQIRLKDIPKGAIEVAAAIDAHLANFVDRVYSVDMALSSDGAWKLFELNAPPGLPLIGEGDDIQPHFEALATHLMTCEPTTNPVFIS